MIKLKYIGSNYIEDTSFIIDRPDGSGDWLFLLFHSDIFIDIRGHIEHLSPGAMMLYTPDCPQYYLNPNHNLDNDWFHFTESNFMTFVDEINLPINKPFYIDDIAFVHPTIQEIEKEHLMKDIGFNRMIDQKIKSLFIEISRDYNHDDDLSDFYGIERNFREIRSNILSSISRPWTVTEMAELANLSRSRFTYLYKSIFQVSPKDDLIKTRFNMAKYLLQGSNLPISTIALKVGYTDIYHFSKQFKAITSQSPSEYRKLWQHNNKFI